MARRRTVTRVLIDLLNTASTRALQGNDTRLAGEDFLVLQFCKCELLRLVDKAIDVKEISSLIDLRDTAMVSHEEVLVVCNLILHETVL